MRNSQNYGRIILLWIALTIITSCSQTRTIHILQTTDLHGAIFPYDFVNNESKTTCLAQVYSYVKGVRSQHSNAVILLDNGDVLQGQPIVYYSNFIDTIKPNIVSQTLNFLGYDAATVGNHDIEAGPEVYRKVEKEFNFPWLAANITSTTTGKCAFTPYTIIERNGVKVAVIGLITPSIPKWLPKQMWADMEFEDMVESAMKWIEIVKTNEKPDIIIGLFHAGHDYTYGGATKDEPKNENASLLVATDVPGFDAVMIGHDHDTYMKKIQNIDGDSVLIIDPASSAKYVSHLTIKVKKNLIGKTTAKTITGELVNMRDYLPDSSFMSTFAEDFNSTKAYVNQIIGHCEQDMSSDWAYFEPTAFIDFIHKTQFVFTGADISFVAPLSFVTTINKGDITISDMFKLYKYENFLYTIWLTGEEVDRYLEYNVAQWFNTMETSNDHLLNFKTNPDGSLAMNKQGKVQLAYNYYSFDSGAGIIYTIDVTKPAGQKVNIVSMANGTAFDPNKRYKVAINSYRGSGGGGHLTTGVGLSHEELLNRQIASTDRDLRYCITEYITNEKRINPKLLNTWKLIPEEWTKDAAKRDYKLLFPNRKDQQ